METRPRPEPKIYRVVRFLASGRSLHCLISRERVGDTCPHSTVCEIERRLGLRVDRIPTKMRGFAGTPTRVTKYRLTTPEQRERAREILRERKR